MFSTVNVHSISFTFKELGLFFYQMHMYVYENTTLVCLLYLYLKRLTLNVGTPLGNQNVGLEILLIITETPFLNQIEHWT